METLTERKIYTVSEINREIKTLLEAKFHNVWIKGEISNFRMPPSGHYYFTLKDESAQLKAVCFRLNNAQLKFKLEDGLEVLARGRLTAYEPRGDYQIVVEQMEPVGLGSLQLAFEQLKEKLRKEGLFDPARKRPLPLLPRKIGIVTSPTGAAIRDILRILKRRNKSLHVLIAPTKVQGDGAAAEVSAAIRYMNTLADIDVLIVGRGGGSIEDLWSFNEEVVARAIFNSRIPVISAVGHEIDFTIADFVADLRAPTPSAAAEVVSAAREELKHRVDTQLRRLQKTAAYLLENRRARLALLTQSPGFTSFPNRIREQAQRVDDSFYRMNVAARNVLVALRNRFALLEDRLTRINLAEAVNKRRDLLAQDTKQLNDLIDNVLNSARKMFEIQLSKFNTLSPLAVLDRGYSICRNRGGAIVKSTDQVRIGEELKITLAKGELSCEIKNIVSTTDRGERSSSVRSSERAQKVSQTSSEKRADQPSLLFGSTRQPAEESEHDGGDKI